MKLFLHLTSLLTSASAITVRTLYQFPNPTWLENIATMRNGSLLITVIGRAEVQIVNPTSSPATASIVTTFPSANATLGITEISPNIFAVAVGSTTPSNEPIPQSFSLWALDFNSHPRYPLRGVKVTKVVNLDRMQLPNGIVAVNPTTVLLADSYAGNIVRLDIPSKTYEVGIQDASLAANFSAPGVPIGVNGVRLHKGFLYYSNSVQKLLGRVPISDTGVPMGAFSVFGKGGEVMLPDDFTVEEDGDVLVASPIGDSLQVVGLNGRAQTLAKGGVINGGTAVVRGRKGVVYMCTSGLEGGMPASGGRVLEINGVSV